MIPKLFIGITPTCFKSGSIYKIDQKSREVCGIDNEVTSISGFVVSKDPTLLSFRRNEMTEKS